MKRARTEESCVDRDPENVEEEITGYNLRADGDEEVESGLNIQ